MQILADIDSCRTRIDFWGRGQGDVIALQCLRTGLPDAFGCFEAISYWLLRTDRLGPNGHQHGADHGQHEAEQMIRSFHVVSV